VRTRSFDPGWVDEYAVAALGTIGADCDQLETLVAGLEGPHRFGADANNVPAAERADLVVEPDVAGATDDDVGLLLFAMGMRRE
jgi:hypothetical protein